jgi:UDP-glucose 4-epimerase
MRLPSLEEKIDWSQLLADVDCVVHLAAVAHRGAAVPDETYDRVNHRAVADLAAAAARAKLARVILVSSIGSQTGPSADSVLSETDEAHPINAYGRSKLAAEAALRASGAAYTIFRPVLMYGPGAPGNMRMLVRLARLPAPLPFGSFSGRRSLLAIDNLAGAVEFAIKAPATVNETYLVADRDALTLPEIVTALRAGLGRSPGLVPVPQWLFGGGLRLIGQGDLWRRLGGSLVASPAKLIAAGWQPAVDTRAGLEAMMRARSSD